MDAEQRAEFGPSDACIHPSVHRHHLDQVVPLSPGPGSCSDAVLRRAEHVKGSRARKQDQLPLIVAELSNVLLRQTDTEQLPIAPRSDNVD